MPTGITAPIYKDEPTTMRQFILRCARHMHILARYKEHSVDWEIPQQIEADSSYYNERLAGAERELSTLEKLSEEGIESAAQAYHAKERDEAEAYNAKRNALRMRYENLLEQVLAWGYVEELEGLKRFALEQLTDSISSDCDGSDMTVKEISPQEWYKNTFISLRWDIEHSTEEIEKEKGRVVVINTWLKALHENLEVTG